MKISVIVPVYKVEEYIERCIDSIINQTYKDLEIILVDDGSPDNCPKICDIYAEKDNRIKVIHKQNGGLSDARNKGIELAKGEYILLVDSDDSIIETACEELARIIEKEEADIICFNANEIGKDNMFKSANDKNYIVLDNKETFKKYIKRDSIRNEAWSRIYKTELAKAIKYPIGILAEDLATAHQFILNANKIIYYDNSLYNYYHRENSITGEKSYKLFYDTYHNRTKLYETAKKVVPEILKDTENIYFLILVKVYTKFYDNSDEEYKKLKSEVKDKLDSSNPKLLSVKNKIIFYTYKISKRLFMVGMKKIYKKI